MAVPYWVEDAIFYQIFPDRFFNGDVTNDPPNKQPWGAPPDIYGFQGGDLRGVIQKLDYLLDLGINAIYFTPIFQASSNHRYNTYDYLKIDPKLGDLRDFRALIDVAHQNGVRIVLDGVFNHVGRGFFAFNDILENQEHSPYRDWFHILKYPVEAYDSNDATTYVGWWKNSSLPKLNTSNLQVRRYLMQVARYWIEQGADGWRLDVPNEINDDDFWAEFRDVVKTANPEAYLLGEIWNGDPRWVGDRHFDGLMNYPLREALLGILTGKLAVGGFAEKLEGLLHKQFAPENASAMYNLIGSHDTERALTLLNGDAAKLKLAWLIQMALPGAPAVYYGDEMGLEGGKDPECRKAFPWETSAENLDLHDYLRKLIHLRKQMPVLRRGSYQRVLAEDGRGCLAFARALGEQRLAVAFNASATRRQVRLNAKQIGWRDGLIITDLLTSKQSIVSGDSLTLMLQPWSGAWLSLA
ncbi:glycosidase [Longilinea arvoryzae]|uniref:Glycosidase n=1 Tax=Longilinea arvoryzae TaxID=360412 RepID=A0A0S7BIN8_9CHLR|nr:glycoside hydrolase family 13 protein [Longilinea arvoryzae]GAP14451.1 glycosidase [Longilinea arvoryzae]